jgi:hypothetical protein
MAKVNSTYNGGYFIPENFDYKKMPEDEVTAAKKQRKQDQQRDQKRRRDEEGVTGPKSGPAFDDAKYDSVLNASKRVTWMTMFSVICDGCKATVPKNTKVYVNLTKSKKKYLGQPIFALAMKCPRCGLSEFVWHTDPENRTYKISSGARMAGGDWASIAMAEKEEARKKEMEAPAETDAEQEMQDKIEQHQLAVLGAERVDRMLNEELERVFFSKDAVKDSVLARHFDDEEARRKSGDDGDTVALTEADKHDIAERFEHLRRGVAQSASTEATSSQPPRRKVDAAAVPSLAALHEDMLKVLAQPPAVVAEPMAAPSLSDAMPPPAPVVKSKRRGSMLASLDY